MYSPSLPCRLRNGGAPKIGLTKTNWWAPFREQLNNRYCDVWKTTCLLTGFFFLPGFFFDRLVEFFLPTRILLLSFIEITRNVNKILAVVCPVVKNYRLKLSYHGWKTFLIKHYTVLILQLFIFKEGLFRFQTKDRRTARREVL